MSIAISIDRRQAERERRGDRRVPAVFAVRADDGQVCLGQAEDINASGMTLRWPKDAPFVSRAPVTLTFELPGTREPIAAAAQVVSDRRGSRFRRTGVRFTSLAPEHAALIARYCAR